MRGRGRSSGDQPASCGVERGVGTRRRRAARAARRRAAAPRRSRAAAGRAPPRPGRDTDSSSASPASHAVAARYGPRVDAVAHDRRVELAPRGDRLDERAEHVVEIRLDLLAALGRHRLAREHLGGGLVRADAHDVGLHVEDAPALARRRAPRCAARPDGASRSPAARADRRRSRPSTRAARCSRRRRRRACRPRAPRRPRGAATRRRRSRAARPRAAAARRRRADRAPRRRARAASRAGSATRLRVNGRRGARVSSKGGARRASNQNGARRPSVARAATSRAARVALPAGAAHAARDRHQRRSVRRRER